MLKQSALRYVLASSMYPGFIIPRTGKQLCVVTAASIYNALLVHYCIVKTKWTLTNWSYCLTRQI